MTVSRQVLWDSSRFWRREALARFWFEVGDRFRVAAIPRRVERAFSKRRQAIEAAAAQHGYRSPKGLELAALRTRRSKRDVSRDALFDAWRAEARELGFELARDAVRG
jgi:conjugative relaxase-like TrwC/TraI family protein